MHLAADCSLERLVSMVKGLFGAARSKERDNQSGLDYFGARYSARKVSRFLLDTR